jgi:OHCU decarboxylase
MMTIQQLNKLPLSQFVAELSLLFEGGGPLLQSLFTRRPFGSFDELFAAAERIVLALPEDQQLALLEAHPRIGQRTSLSEYSRREQGDDEEAEVLAQLEELNRAYEERFGFRFVVFVNGRSRRQIVPVLRERLRRNRSDELETAVRDLVAIAHARSTS